MAPAQQDFRAVEPTLYDVALRTDPNCKLERAAEMIGAETGHPGEIGQSQSIIEMCLDIVLDPFAARRVRRPADTAPHWPDPGTTAKAAAGSGATNIYGRGNRAPCRSLSLSSSSGLRSLCSPGCCTLSSGCSSSPSSPAWWLSPRSTSAGSSANGNAALASVGPEAHRPPERHTFPQGSDIETARASNQEACSRSINDAVITRSGAMDDPEPRSEGGEATELRSAAAASLQSAVRQNDPREFDRLTHHALRLIELARAIQHGRQRAVSTESGQSVSRDNLLTSKKKGRPMSRKLMTEFIGTLLRLCSWRSGR